MHRLPPVVLVLLLSPAIASASLPPDCSGGPLDVAGNVILDFGRSTKAVLEDPGLVAGFLPAPGAFGDLPDPDIAHVAAIIRDSRSVDVEQCAAPPVDLRLGESACLCGRRDLVGCDFDKDGEYHGPPSASLFSCPPPGSTCCGAADGLSVIGCRDRTAEEGVVEVDVVVEYTSVNVVRPHLYTGLANLATQEQEDVWHRLRGRGGHQPPGQVAPPGQAREDDDPPPGTIFPPGQIGAREVEPFTLPLTLRLVPENLHYLQLTVVERGPDRHATPPSGLVGFGETESWELVASPVAGGAHELIVLPEDGDVSDMTCE